MKLTQRASAAAALVATAVIVTSCSAPEPSGSGSEGGGGGDQAIVIGETNKFTSFNPEEASSNVEVNSKITDVTTAKILNVDPEANVTTNDDVGTMEPSNDNKTVKYTVKEGIKWSDGNPVDAGDLLLEWAVRSGYYDDAKMGEDGKPVSGQTFFNYAGDTSGLGLTELPEISEDGRSITLNYSQPYVDWEIAYDLPYVPAHVLAKRAGLADEQALVDLFLNTPKGDPEKPREAPELKAVADVWNNDFKTKTLPTDPELFLSSGPFIVSGIEPDQSLTLKKNENYGGEPAKLDEVTVKYFTEASAAVAALKNGEADLIAPQASRDTLSQLKEMESQGVKTLTGNMLAYDHIDLKFKPDGVFADPAVREAFLLSLPREDIVKKVVGELDPNAKPLDSMMFTGDQDGYDAAVAANGSAKYAKRDVEKAKELLAGKTPEVKIMYNKDNANRLDTYTLIADKAGEAGFKVVDLGKPASEWGKALTSNEQDAQIFGWINNGVSNTATGQIFASTGGSNFTGYANADVDRIAGEINVTAGDEAKLQELKIEVDKKLYEDGYGLPLFQSIGAVGVSERVEGADVYNPGQAGVWWNLEKLSVK